MSGTVPPEKSALASNPFRSSINPEFACLRSKRAKFGIKNQKNFAGNRKTNGFFCYLAKKISVLSSKEALSLGAGIRLDTPGIVWYILATKAQRDRMGWAKSGSEKVIPKRRF